MKHDSIIYSRSISLDITIPEKYVFDFMKEFAEVFSGRDAMEGGKYIQPVDTYSYHPNGWHIKITVWDQKENMFYDFLSNFCKERKISFRDPRPKDDKKLTFSELKIGAKFIILPKAKSDSENGFRADYSILEKVEPDSDGFNAIVVFNKEKGQIPDYAEVVKIQ